MPNFWGPRDDEYDTPGDSGCGCTAYTRCARHAAEEDVRDREENEAMRRSLTVAGGAKPWLDKLEDVRRRMPACAGRDYLDAAINSLRMSLIQERGGRMLDGDVWYVLHGRTR